MNYDILKRGIDEEKEWLISNKKIYTDSNCFV